MSLYASGVANDFPLYGDAFAGQPFIYEPGGAAGTHSPDEWFYNSGIAGVDGLDVINGLIDDYAFISAFASSLGIVADVNGDYLTIINGGGHNILGGAVPGGINSIDFLELLWLAGVGADVVDAAYGGGLSGKMKVSYASENIFGFGVNHIFYADNDSFLDQLVVRFEASYTPNKKLINNLRR